MPMLNDTFDRIAATLDRFAGGRLREIVNMGVVGTFAIGWLLPRLKEFEALHPFVDLRIMTNNNRVDLAGEGLDFAIRYGDGSVARHRRRPDPGRAADAAVRRRRRAAAHDARRSRTRGSAPVLPSR